jgi:predicted nucleic acid-binding protein
VKTLVVDASVAVKWLLEENGSASARRLFSPRRRLIAPDLLELEFANAVWKRVQRREMQAEQAEELFDDFQQIVGQSLEIVASHTHLSTALGLAIVTGSTVYDCLYLSLAMSQDSSLITSVLRFVNLISETPFAKSVKFLGALN